MNLVYTHRGFPTLVDVTSSVIAIYESPEVSNIDRRRREQTRPGFDEELEHIKVYVREWTRTHGFFAAALDPLARLSGTAQAFIAETALYLTKRITRRRVMFQDRAMFLKQDTVVATRVPTFTNEELFAIKELCQYTPETLIQMWIVIAGVDDLAQTLQLYVGDRSITAS